MTGSATEYLVQKDGSVRSLSEAKLRRALRRNAYSGLELVRREDETQWRPLHDTPLYAEEVPVDGDPRDHARWKLLRGFVVHLLVFLAVLNIAPNPGLWFWAIGLFLHGVKVVKPALGLWHEGKIPLLPQPRSVSALNSSREAPGGAHGRPAALADPAAAALTGAHVDDTLAATTPEGADPLYRKLREDVRGRLFGEGAAPFRIGRYVLQSQVGAGGMGIVYRAADESLGRQVALKLLRPGIALDAGPERLLREARAMARLNHPNVVTVYDVGTFESSVFVAMEFIEGVNVRQWLEAPRTVREIVTTLRQAGEGVAAAHAAGLVHRDFKPDNVMIGGDGRVRVLDFGLAKPSDADASRESLTKTGAVVGTLRYMAPEQLRGEPATDASDQFAFAVVLYEAIFGEHPYAGTDDRPLQRNLLAGRRRATPDRGDVPPDLRAAIDRALASDPEDRFPSLRAMMAAFVVPPAVADRFAVVAAAVRRSLGRLDSERARPQLAALASIEETVIELDQAIDRLGEALDPVTVARLRNELESARAAPEHAEAPDRELAQSRVRALEARGQGVDQAGEVLERLKGRRGVALVRLERLQLDLLRSEARSSALLDLSVPLHDLQVEVEAAEEVEALLRPH